MWCILLISVISLIDPRNAMEQNAVTINRALINADYQDLQQLQLQQQQNNTKGSVRCVCNLPSCISTAYMCKSTIGGCFSDLSNQSSSQQKGRHGCVELLSEKERDWCQRNSNGNAKRRRNRHPRSSLLNCCYNDMCNHIDDQHTRSLMNETESFDSLHQISRVEESHLESGYGSADVWFKAATIAVPICGAVIVVALIVLAVKMLRAESQSGANHKLGCSYISSNNYHEKNFDTSQNLLQKHCVGQGSTPIFFDDPRRYHRAPIVIQNKEMNRTRYNILGQQQQQPAIPAGVHRCFASGCKNTNLEQSSCPEIGYYENGGLIDKRNLNSEFVSNK